MICPHCNTGVSIEFEEYFLSRDPDAENSGYQIACEDCPECERLIVLLRTGPVVTYGSNNYEYETLGNVKQEEVLFPKHHVRSVEPEVPSVYKKDLLEASAVLSLSAKASAALSRRLLQKLLREQYSISHGSLAREIELFIQRNDVPSYLVEAVDAVRNVGNFAAHPLKDTSTGEIVEVEPGEAEWLLEVLESLFDFTFVQPKRLAERRNSLNEKLKSIGKPPMK